MKPKNYFNKVKELVASGFTILEATDNIGVSQDEFYENITKEQKVILSRLTEKNKISTFGDSEMEPIEDLQEFFTSTEND